MTKTEPIKFDSSKYKQDFRKANYDTIYLDCKKGLKKVLSEELAKENETTAGFLNKLIIRYLERKGYTEEQLNEIVEQARKAD